MTDAEFACALSHRRIYQRILEHGLLGAVILEDDVILSPQFARFIKGEGCRIADFIQMGYGTARVYRYRNRRWSNDIELAPLAQRSWSAIAYSVTAHGAGYILSGSERVSGFADWPVDIMPLMPVVTLPMIVGHPPRLANNSYIEAGRLALE